MIIFEGRGRRMVSLILLPVREREKKRMNVVVRKQWKEMKDHYPRSSRRMDGD